MREKETFKKIQDKHGFQESYERKEISSLLIKVVNKIKTEKGKKTIKQ